MRAHPYLYTLPFLATDWSNSIFSSIGVVTNSHSKLTLPYLCTDSEESLFYAEKPSAFWAALQIQTQLWSITHFREGILVFAPLHKWIVPKIQWTHGAPEFNRTSKFLGQRLQWTPRNHHGFVVSKALCPLLYDMVIRESTQAVAEFHLRGYFPVCKPIPSEDPFVLTVYLWDYAPVNVTMMHTPLSCFHVPELAKLARTKDVGVYANSSSVQWRSSIEQVHWDHPRVHGVSDKELDSRPIKITTPTWAATVVPSVSIPQDLARQCAWMDHLSAASVSGFDLDRSTLASYFPAGPTFTAGHRSVNPRLTFETPYGAQMHMAVGLGAERSLGIFNSEWQNWNGREVRLLEHNVLENEVLGPKGRPNSMGAVHARVLLTTVNRWTWREWDLLVPFIRFMLRSKNEPAHRPPPTQVVALAEDRAVGALYRPYPFTSDPVDTKQKTDGKLIGVASYALHYVTMAPELDPIPDDLQAYLSGYGTLICPPGIWGQQDLSSRAWARLALAAKEIANSFFPVNARHDFPFAESPPSPKRLEVLMHTYSAPDDGTLKSKTPPPASGRNRYGSPYGPQR